MMVGEIKLPAPVAEAIERLLAAGFDAYAVGGCVRDSLIGREPNDWDITTAATPSETAQVFADCRTLDIGIKHGTLTVLLGGMTLEITAFRNDGVYEDNRHPVQVTFSDTVEEDLARRDFTVNAMAYRPGRGLVDLYGGREDLARGVIACVGEPERRFCEDGLRILRAIRFASVLDFDVEAETARAVHAQRGLLANIAAERIREEFCKLICGKGAVRILRDFSDVVAQFIPEIGACVGFAQNSKYHCHDVYEHSLRALAETESRDLATRLAILLHDIGKPLCYTEDAAGGHFKGHGPVGTAICDTVLYRMRFDRDTRERVCRLVEWHDRDIPATERAVKRLMCKLPDEDILRLMEVKRCDRLAHAEGYCTPPESLIEIPALMERIREEHACLSLKSLELTGNDLMQLGMHPGKEIGRLLQRLLDAVIDGELPNDRDRLRAAAKEMLSEPDSAEE